jgi:hypothetical protein
MADVTGTPYISRTPFGGAGMETPMPYNPAQKIMDEREAKRRKIDLSNGLDVSCIALCLQLSFRKLNVCSV